MNSIQRKSTLSVYNPFSIDSILGTQTKECLKRHLSDVEHNNNNNQCTDKLVERPDFTTYPTFDWLQCTRYKPPKVTRVKRKKYMSMNVSRQPRIPFTPFQQSNLEAQFHERQYLTSHRLHELSDILGLPKQRIKIWYQNRRARERREENSKVKKN